MQMLQMSLAQCSTGKLRGTIYTCTFITMAFSVTSQPTLHSTLAISPGEADLLCNNYNGNKFCGSCYNGSTYHQFSFHNPQSNLASNKTR